MATDRDEQQRQQRELEEIRRSFAEMGARMGSMFDPPEPDEAERSQPALLPPAPPVATSSPMEHHPTTRRRCHPRPWRCSVPPSPMEDAAPLGGLTVCPPEAPPADCGRPPPTPAWVGSGRRRSAEVIISCPRVARVYRARSARARRSRAVRCALADFYYYFY